MSYDAFRRWRELPVAAPELSIVVPAYNETERILPTLAAFAVVVSGLVPSWELIVSDDGSRDGTADLVDALDWANLRVVRHTNTGKGGAVRRGVLAARGRRILFADADNSTPIEQLPQLLAALDDGAAVAIASRAADGAAESDKSALRRLASGGFRRLSRQLIGVRVGDTQCGFKAFERGAALELFGRQRTPGFAFDLELLFLAGRLGLRVDEIAVRWYDAPGSKVSTVRDSLRMLGDLLRLRRLARRGAYRLPGDRRGAADAGLGPALDGGR